MVRVGTPVATGVGVGVQAVVLVPVGNDVAVTTGSPGAGQSDSTGVVTTRGFVDATVG